MTRPDSTRRRFLGLAGAGALTLVLAAAPGRAAAAGAEITVTLGSPSIEVGQAVYLQVEVATEGGRIGEPRFVGLDHVDVSSRGVSSGLSVALHGSTRVQRSTKTFTYVLTPRQAGDHTIKVEVEVDGQVQRATTKPTLTATGAGQKPAAAVVAQAKPNDTPPASDDEVIVWPVVNKNRVYVGEQIVYELQIWEDVRANLSVTAAPTFKDFWSENLMPDSQDQRRAPTRKALGGRVYRVHPTMRRALFPQTAGTLTIGGPEVQMQQLAGPFFGGSGPPKSFVGRGLAIEVLPLPAAGQPPGFRPNNVGQLRIAATVDRSQLTQGEALRLSISIAGVGNIALVELPPMPKIDGLRSYEPKPQTPQFDLGKSKLEGSRVYTMLVVADQAGELTIPALELPYFNPVSKRYEVAKTEPIRLEVEANPDAEPASSASADASTSDAAGDELLAPPIAGGPLGRVTPREPWLSRERWWAGTLAAPGVLGLGFIGAKLLRRFGPDDRARARSREFGRRRMLLTEASAAVDSDDGFYPKLASLLQAAAVGRAGSEGVGLTRDRLIKLLAERGAEPSEIEQLRELLEACDAARFGAGSGELEQRRAHLEEARTLLRKREWGPQ